jgi:enhancing lycopene biosynthesis protein 2
MKIQTAIDFVCISPIIVPVLFDKTFVVNKLPFYAKQTLF